MADNIKIILLGFLAVLFSGCPGSAADCSGFGHETEVDSLMTFEPLQSQYDQGDLVTIKLTIPSANNYFSSVGVNIFEETHDENGWFFFVMYMTDTLFAGNEVEFVKGSVKDGTVGWFNVPYNPDNGLYEFEMKVHLTRLGFYKIPARLWQHNIQFSGNDECNTFFLNTNFTSANPAGNIEFTVE